MPIFETPPQESIISGSYDLGLVFFSYIIAFFSSYTALSITNRIRGSFNLTQKLWMAGCALSMGCGIWSMHFTSMLAFQLPMPVSYHFELTALSLIFAVVASGYGLFICSFPPPSLKKTATGGIVMGIGVAAMHYSGMSAMQMDATIYYSPGLFIVSIGIAIVGAFSALWLLTKSEKTLKSSYTLRVWSALIMAFAVFGMHFTGMAATHFVSNGLLLQQTLPTSDSKILGYSIAAFTFLIFGIAIFASTVQKEFEKLRLIKDEAERASQAKSEFLSRMSHELRTPLNSILGFSQLMEIDPDITEKQKHFLDHIKNSGRHLLVLIDDVLDLARIEADDYSIYPEPLEIPPLAEELVLLIQPMANANNIRINNQTPGSLPHSFIGDRTRVKQILLNLLTNAIKYNRQGGTVTLSCCQKDDQSVDLLVSDTGPGISEPNLFKLFIPFERLNAGYSKIDGTGIGLTICQDLAKKMDGAILVESEVGKGSQFTLRLPKFNAPASENNDKATVEQ